MFKHLIKLGSVSKNTFGTVYGSWTETWRKGHIRN